MEDLSYVMLEKKDGVTRVLEFDEAKRGEYGREGHLCWTCSNYGNCEKVKDEHKKTIDQYDFITDGIQFIDKNGKSDILVVDNCKTYIKDKKKEKPGMDGIKERQKLKNMYFGEDNIKDADRVMHEIEERDIKAGRRR